MLNIENERKRFETWHYTHFGRKVHRARTEHGGERPGLEYWGDDTNTAWEAWQEARRASPAAAVPEGALPPLPYSGLMSIHGPMFTANQMQAYARAAVEADRAQRSRVTPEMFDSLKSSIKQLEGAQAAREAQMARLGLADRAQQGEPVACAISYWQGYQPNVDLDDDGTGPFTRWSEYKPSTLAHGKAIAERGDKDKRVKWLYDRVATKAAAPADAPSEQDRRALELANAALIAAQPRDIGPKGWERHEAAINATNCALHKPKGAAPVPDTGIPTAEQATEALRVGGVMSNILYNFAQKAGHTLTSDDCALFDKMRKEWDAARCASVSTTPTPEEVEKAGWKWVPIEPTEDMFVAFAETWFSKTRPIDDCGMGDCYAAMLAAAPSHPSEAKAGEDA